MSEINSVANNNAHFLDYFHRNLMEVIFNGFCE